MLPGQVPSDFDLHETKWGEAAGRFTILSDLYGEFQGAAGAYAFFAVLIPGLLVASARYGWTDHNPELLMLGAAVICIALLTVSLYAWVWFRWVRKRLNAVERRMDLLMVEINNGKQPLQS